MVKQKTQQRTFGELMETEEYKAMDIFDCPPELRNPELAGQEATLVFMEGRKNRYVTVQYHSDGNFSILDSRIE